MLRSIGVPKPITKGFDETETETETVWRLHDCSEGKVSTMWGRTLLQRERRVPVSMETAGIEPQTLESACPTTIAREKFGKEVIQEHSFLILSARRGRRRSWTKNPRGRCSLGIRSLRLCRSQAPAQNPSRSTDSLTPKPPPRRRSLGARTRVPFEKEAATSLFVTDPDTVKESRDSWLRVRHFGKLMERMAGCAFPLQESIIGCRRYGCHEPRRATPDSKPRPGW